jgi:hypothetical protein
MSINVTMIGSCFCGYLKEPLCAAAAAAGSSCTFGATTVWQRIDSVADILTGNIPDHELIRHYIDRGHWDRKQPLGLEVQQEIQDGGWFANAILEYNRRALRLGGDSPDLLIFDSLSDWRHPLYRHRQSDWKCFLGKIHFEDEHVGERFERDFEFIRLLDLRNINPAISDVIAYFRRKSPRLKAVYIHFPAMKGYLEEKWIHRAEELKAEVLLLNRSYRPDEFKQLIVPDDIVRPILDPTDPHYSRNIWNHFQPQVYQYCAREIWNWYSGERRARTLLSRLLRFARPRRQRGVPPALCGAGRVRKSNHEIELRRDSPSLSSGAQPEALGGGGDR